MEASDDTTQSVTVDQVTDDVDINFIGKEFDVYLSVNREHGSSESSIFIKILTDLLEDCFLSLHYNHVTKEITLDGSDGIPDNRY